MPRPAKRFAWLKPPEPEGETVPTEPRTVRIDAAIKLTGISSAQLYELIQAVRLDTVKVGRVNLIRYSSLKKLVGQ